MVAVLLLACAGCRKESGEARCLVRAEAEGSETKSVLDAADAWDERISEMSLFSYDTRRGRLEQAVYVRGNTVPVTYDRSVGHELYVLANLGDLTGQAPLYAADMAGFRCDVPGLSVMQEKGMPLCRKAPLPTDGSPLSLRELAASYDALVLNFFFINCPWCIQEFPFLKTALESYGDRVAVLCVSPYDQNADIAAFREELGLPFFMA